jgi:hypothetical protein
MYYSENIELDFNKNAYVNSIDKDINAYFNLSYANNLLSRDFKFAKMEINNMPFT